MNLARITAKGQITIPIEIRKSLGVKEGDKVVFIKSENGIMLANSNKVAWDNIQKAMEGEAEKAGFQSEEDVVQYCKGIRQENRDNTHAEAWREFLSAISSISDEPIQEFERVRFKEIDI